MVIIVIAKNFGNFVAMVAGKVDGMAEVVYDESSLSYLGRSFGLVVFREVVLDIIKRPSGMKDGEKEEQKESPNHTAENPTFVT